MRDHYQRALKALASGDIDTAEEVLAEIEELKDSLDEDHDLIEEMIVRAKGDQPASRKGPTKLRIKRRTVAVEDRSELIKKTAYEIATANSGKASTSEVAKAIEGKGLDLGTKVPGTMIGNVLFKDKSNWDWVEKGVFKYVGLPQ